MNRRKLFSFFAAAPVGVVGAVAAMKEQPIAETVSGPVLGEVQFLYDIEPDYSASFGNHTHTASLPSRAVAKHQVFDGENWVDLNSAQGVQAYNAVLRAK